MNPARSSRLGAASALLAVFLLAACGGDQTNKNPDAGTTGSRDGGTRTQAGGPPAGEIRFGIPEAPAKPEGAIRLTTYNIENLFDDIDDPTLSGRDEDIDDLKPREERAAAAAAIRAVDADILCLQEVESLEALLWFRDEFLADMGYEHVASIDAGNERGIEQSVLSRYPIKSVENWPGAELGGTHPEMYGNEPNDYAGQPILLRRSPLKAVVEIPGADGPYALTLFVMHHKSGRYNNYWREAEARYMVAKLRDELSADPDENIVVLGDFNAQRGADSVEPYLDAGFVDPFDPWEGAETERITHSSGRRIDLLLLSPTVLPEVVPGSAFVLGTIARPAGADWRSPAPEGYASDHYPVSVDLVPVDR
ncbi:MAG: endonuclease/exonuclease/phosphatase family protein [Phycisphaerales bacterium JB037]